MPAPHEKQEREEGREGYMQERNNELNPGLHLWRDPRAAEG